jgi:hypothetical protein
MIVVEGVERFSIVHLFLFLFDVFGNFRNFFLGVRNNGRRIDIDISDSLRVRVGLLDGDLLIIDEIFRLAA